MKYAIFQINNRQYLIRPDEVIEVDKLPQTEKNLSIDRVLLVADDKGVEIGKPYLKKILKFEILGNIQKPKIRVATYKAKANYRRVIGQKREMTQIKLLA